MQLAPRSQAAVKRAAPTPGRMTLANVVKGRQGGKPFRVLVYGVEGCGKTTFAAGAPDPIFLCAEEGTSHLDVARFPVPQTWADALEALRVLTHDEHEFKTLVIDTLDWFEPLCWGHVCAQGGKNNIEDFGYGKGYQMALEHWRALLARLDALSRSRGLHVILVAHAAIKRVDDPYTGPFDRYRMKLHERASDLVREWADAVLFARHEVYAVEKKGKMRGVSSGHRVMHTRWTAAYDAKNRFDLPDSLPLHWDEFEPAARAGEPAMGPSLRREIVDLLPRLPDRAKAEKALDEWAGQNPARLAQLLDKVRAKIALLEVAGDDEGAAESTEAHAEPESEPTPSPSPSSAQTAPAAGPPEDEKDPWGLKPPADTAAPAEEEPPASQPQAQAEASVAESTPPLELAPPKPSQHTTLPAAALPHLTTPAATPAPPPVAPNPKPKAAEAPTAAKVDTLLVPFPKRPKRPADEAPPDEAEQKRLTNHINTALSQWFDPASKFEVRTKGDGGKSVTKLKARDEFRRMWTASPARLREGVDDVWHRLDDAGFKAFLEGAYAKVPGGDKLLEVALRALKKGQQTRGDAALAAEQSAAIAFHQARIAGAPSDEARRLARVAVLDDVRLTPWGRDQALEDPPPAEPPASPEDVFDGYACEIDHLGVGDRPKLDELCEQFNQDEHLSPERKARLQQLANARAGALGFDAVGNREHES